LVIGYSGGRLLKPNTQVYKYTNIPSFPLENVRQNTTYDSSPYGFLIFFGIDNVGKNIGGYEA